MMEFQITLKDEDYDLFWIMIFGDSHSEENRVLVIEKEDGPRLYMSLDDLKDKYSGMSTFTYLDVRGSE